MNYTYGEYFKKFGFEASCLIYHLSGIDLIQHNAYCALFANTKYIKIVPFEGFYFSQTLPEDKGFRIPFNRIHAFSFQKNITIPFDISRAVNPTHKYVYTLIYTNKEHEISKIFFHSPYNSNDNYDFLDYVKEHIPQRETDIEL